MKNLIRELRAKIGRLLTTQERRALIVREELERLKPMPEELVDKQIEQLQLELNK